MSRSYASHVWSEIKIALRLQSDDALELLSLLPCLAQQFSTVRTTTLVKNIDWQWAQPCPCLVIENFLASIAKKNITRAYDPAVVVVLREDEIALLHGGILPIPRNPCNTVSEA